MAGDHVPCDVPRCRSAALWVVWTSNTLPTVLCERCRRSYYASRRVARDEPTAAPLLYGVN